MKMQAQIMKWNSENWVLTYHLISLSSTYT
ncbi:hypothetical protein ALQ15_200093 [Pseudomonas syringae pv. actinidiae]|uniref:Uncharacterized protein n=1 Tax=Pseudomonas syringae pv. actinidiae TaxID=103796 RepID=A0A7Z6U4I6_PSESF|nr:hypothetical protein ALQ15_200093 [Pseudomonas syringae pv. actinidiae]